MEGALAALYGGIAEAILARLFLMSLFAWLLGFVWPSRDGSTRRRVLLAANLLATFLFGLGHLPAAAAVTALTPAVVVSVIGLNMVGALVFGYLYIRRGLESAMLAHMAGDVVLHFVGPLLGL